MTGLVLTPFTSAEAVELGNRLWRKKVLPIGEVEYKGRMLHFTRDYLGRLVQSFKSGAYDDVPFQLATDDNAHTNNPERTRGHVTGMELTDDGLYVTAEVTPAGEQVLTENPKLGISARIVEDYARSDGKHFPAAIQHVLGTLDPRIPGLGAWQAIEAANPEADTVLDLSAESFTGEQPKADRKAAKKAAKAAKQEDTASGDAGTDPEGTAAMADLGNLTDAQRAKLAALLDLPDEQLDALAAGGVVLTPDEVTAMVAPDAEDDGEDGAEDDGDDLVAQIEGMTDEQLAALEAEFNAETTEAEAPAYRPNTVPEGEPVAAGLTAEAQFAIDLANARQEETARELAVVTARLREEDYQAEKRRLADSGVPPYITELARPLLEGAGHAVELSNGKTVDAGAVMRRVLTEYARQARLLDLDVELGSPMDEPEGVAHEQADASREDLVSRFKNVTGLR